MKVTLAQSTPDGRSATIELTLDDALAAYPDTLRQRLDAARGVLDQLLADRPGLTIEPEPPANHAPAIAIATAPEPTPAAEGPTYGPADPGPPRSGKSLYRWARRRDERERTTETFAFLRLLGVAWGIGDRMIEWSDDDATAAYHEAVAKLDAIPMSKGGAS